MIALDTNVFINAHRAESTHHPSASAALRQAMQNDGGWGMALTSVGEFWSAVTHPKLFQPPSTLHQAEAFLLEMTKKAGAEVWLPAPGFEARWIAAARREGVMGPRIFDHQISLLAIENGARELWTFDANFQPASGIRLRILPPP